MYQVDGSSTSKTANNTVSPPTVSAPTVSATAPTGPQTVGNSSEWVYLGCYSEATNERALSGLENPISSTAVTIEACAVACAGYNYFGAEYSSQCYCGDTINNGSVLVDGSTPAQTQCDMTCSGNASEYCGGPDRLNMYRYSGAPVVASIPSGPVTVTNVTGASYLGCYSEGTNERALSGLQNPIQGNVVTVEACSVACAGYKYFGVEYSG